MASPAIITEAAVTVDRSARRLATALGRWPWWCQVLGIYAVARAWSALIFQMASRQQHLTGWAPANPGYFDYVGLFWDAEWYHRIATGGYPATLPVGTDGLVQQNQWAFFPLFPAASRAVMTLTSLPWQVVAPTLALLAGGAAMLLIYAVVRDSYRGTPTRRHRIGLATVLLTSFFPSSPVLQVAYTESFALLGIAGFLWLLVRRHYAWAIPVALLLGLTRAVALPLTLVVIAHGYVRWRGRGRDPVRAGDWVQLVVLTVVTFASGFLWQVVTGIATGRPDAYFATQSAWRAGNTVVPIEPWLTVGRWLFGTPGAIVAFVGVLAAIALAVLARPAWQIGTELQVFVGAYLLYLVGVIEPGTSLARFLLLAFPLGAITAAVSRSRAYLTVTTLSFALFQIVWVVWLWQLNATQGWPP